MKRDLTNAAPTRLDVTLGDDIGVVHFHRRPTIDTYSVEGLFSAIRDSLSEQDCRVTVATAPCESVGLLNRFRNMSWACKHARHVNHITGDINYIALVLPKSKTILTIHDLTTLHRLTGFKRWLYKMFWFKLPVLRSRLVTAISQFTKDELCRELDLPSERVLVIPNAVPRIFQPAPYSFNSTCPRILQIGTRPNKNVLRLLQSLKGITCHLHLVGYCDQQTQRAIKESGIPHTLDHDLTLTEIYEAYCNADLVTLISTNEGFGMPIIEAQWVERPVVTSNCSSMPEVAGDGACLVDPLNILDIRRGIERVLHDATYREILIECGRQNRTRFQTEEVAAQYARLYCEIST